MCGRRKEIVVFIMGLASLVIAVSPAQAPKNDSLSASVLKQMSLEELMDIDITIVSKRSERWFEAAAAVHVISADEIRRSGARSIPEALRLAPNLNVAQVDARQWAISARGFTSTTANKLLVLIDGRSVYTQLYSGVFWDAQDVLLADVDRIEVISGPGGTLWGTNAVNGIINVITKTSRETHAKPLRAEANAGLWEKFSGSARYSASLGSAAFYRAYLKYFDRGKTRFEAGGDAQDSWTGTQGGFRLDHDLSANDVLTLQGDGYQKTADQPVNDRIRLSGGNMLATLSHSFSDRSTLRLQTYFDYTHRRIPGVFGEDLGVFDLELNHTATLTDNHEINWGLEFRHSNDRVVNSASLAFLPPNLQTRLYSGFIQDVISISEAIKITLGSKFSRNDFSGFEIQPRVSIGWALSSREFFWASVSRAVRRPSRIDRDLYAPGVPPYVIAGGNEFTSEKVIAFESGYRVQPHRDLFLDLALFYNLYDDLRSVEPGPPLVLKNGLEAKTYGGEIVVNTQAASWWKIKAGYGHLQKSMKLKPWSRDANVGSSEGNDPKHRLFLQSLMDVMERWELDLWIRYIDKLPNLNARVPSYTSVDCRLGWNLTTHVSVSALFQNIFDAYHVEFGSPSTRKEIGREVFGRVSVVL